MRAATIPHYGWAVTHQVKFALVFWGRDNTYIAIASGANMDFDRLRFVSERADESETLMSVVIPEQPGAFKALYDMVYPRNVTELSYRITAAACASENGSQRGDAKDDAHVYISYQSKSGADAESVRCVTHGPHIFLLTFHSLASHGYALNGRVLWGTHRSKLATHGFQTTDL